MLAPVAALFVAPLLFCEGADGPSDVAPIEIVVEGERDRTIQVGDVLSDARFLFPDGDATAFVQTLPVRIVIRDSVNVKVDVEDIVGDDVFAWAGGDASVSNLSGPTGSGSTGRGSCAGSVPAPGPRFQLDLPVEIVVERSSHVQVDVEDVFGDNVVAFAAGDAVVDVSNLGGPRATPPGLPGPGAFRLHVPFTVEVVDSEDVNVNVEDVAGDLVVTWSEGSAEVSNLSGGGDAPLRLLDPSVEVRMPLEVYVTRSERVVVDFEDLLGDDVFAWTRSDAVVSNLGSGAIGASRKGDVRLAVPVSVGVWESRDVTVDVEDVVGDDVLAWAGGDARVSNLTDGREVEVGELTLEAGVDVEVHTSHRVIVDVEDVVGDVVLARAADEAELSNLRNGAGGGLWFENVDARVLAPVRARIMNSEDVQFDVEDLFGDDVSAWSEGAATVSNGGRLPPGGTSGRLSVRVPIELWVFESRRVTLGLEDAVGDVVLAGASADVNVSNVRPRGAASVHGSPLSIELPFVLRIDDASEVTVDVEDLFGDVTLAAAAGALEVSQLNGGRGPPLESPLLSSVFSIAVPVDVAITGSEGVDVDMEDIFGDTTFLLFDADVDPRWVLIDVDVDVAIRESTDALVEIAEIFTDSLFVLPGAEQRTLESPGVYMLPQGTLALYATFDHEVVDSPGSDVVLEETFFARNEIIPQSAYPLPEAGGAATEDAAVAGLALSREAASPGGPGALTLRVVPGPRLARHARALEAAERAAALWAAHLEDPVEIEIEVRVSDWLPRGILAQTRTSPWRLPYDEVRAALAEDAADELGDGQAHADRLARALPAGALPASLPPGIELSDAVSLSAANARALGFVLPEGSGPDAVIVIDAALALEDGPALERIFGHELGHALGFLSAVDAVNLGRRRVAPTPLDLFRFADVAAGSGTGPFASTPRNLVPGAPAVLALGGRAWPMTTGERTGRFAGLDGYQARHWALGSAAGLMVGDLDPEGPAGPSCADLAALDAIGYEVRRCP